MSNKKETEIIVLAVSESFHSYHVSVGNGYEADFEHEQSIGKGRKHKYLHVGGWWSTGINFTKKAEAIEFMTVVNNYLKRKGHDVRIVKNEYGA